MFVTLGAEVRKFAVCDKYVNCSGRNMNFDDDNALQNLSIFFQKQYLILQVSSE